MQIGTKFIKVPYFPQSSKKLPYKSVTLSPNKVSITALIAHTDVINLATSNMGWV